MTSSLVLYEEMVAAVAKCVAVDEADQIRSKAAKLEAYARIRDDRETQTKFAELRLRATQRIGELSRELETAQGPIRDNGVVNKTRQLKEAGLDIRTAQRYEQLSGPREDQAKRIVAQATNSYFANLPGNQTPTFKGFRQAVHSALVDTYGDPPPRKKHELSKIDRAYMKWNSLMMDLMEVDPELAAEGEHAEFANDRYSEANRAILKIERYQRRLDELHGLH